MAVCESPDFCFRDRDALLSVFEMVVDSSPEDCPEPFHHSTVTGRGGAVPLLCRNAAVHVLLLSCLQTLLAMLAYAGLFTVPWCYYRFKPLIDAVVYDFLHLVTLLVMHAERWAYVVAAVAAVGVWQLLATEDGQGSMVVQASGASAAALAVLGWRVMAAEA